MSQDNNFSQGPVPQSARKGVLALTFVMLGLTFFSASMWTGGTLGTGLSYHDFFLAVLIGNLLLGIYTSFLGYIGAKTGLTTATTNAKLSVSKGIASSSGECTGAKAIPTSNSSRQSISSIFSCDISCSWSVMLG